MLLYLLLEQQQIIESMLRLCNFGQLGVSAQRAAVVAAVLSHNGCPAILTCTFMHVNQPARAFVPAVLSLQCMYGERSLLCQFLPICLFWHQNANMTGCRFPAFCLT